MTRPATINTGGPDDVFPGARVTWMYIPRGGYGYAMPIEAKVLSCSCRPGTRVTLQVTTATGYLVKRDVDIANVRW